MTGRHAGPPHGSAAREATASTGYAATHRAAEPSHDERCCMAGAWPGWGPHPDCPGQAGAPTATGIRWAEPEPEGCQSCGHQSCYDTCCGPAGCDDPEERTDD